MVVAISIFFVAVAAPDGLLVTHTRQRVTWLLEWIMVIHVWQVGGCWLFGEKGIGKSSMTCL